MIYPTRHTDKTTLMGDPVCDKHSKLTYDICHAVDTLAMHGILDRMVESGMDRNTASLFRTQADLLRAMLLTENNRVHGF